MANLLKPFQVIKQTVTSKEGEVTVNINLHLTISLDDNGQVNVNVKKDKDIDFVVPEFTADKLIEDFGEEVK